MIRERILILDLKTNDSCGFNIGSMFISEGVRRRKPSSLSGLG